MNVSVRVPTSFSLVFLCVASCCLPLAAQSPEAAEAAKILTPTTVALLRVDAEALAAPTGVLAAEELQPIVQVMQAVAGPNDAWITVNFKPSIVSPSILLYGGASGTSLEEVNAGLGGTGYGPAARIGDFNVVDLVKPSRVDNEHRVTLDTERTGVLATALDTVKDATIAGVVLPPTAIWRAYEESFTSLPAEFGGMPVSVITRGMQWASFSVDAQNLTTRARIQSQSATDAQQLAQALPELINGTVSALPLRRAESLLESLRSFTDASTVAASGDTVQVTMDAGELSGRTADSAKALLGQTVAPLLARRKQDQLKTMMLAVFNYESANRVFPPAKNARNAEGQPWLSWRVHVLPYMGDEGLALWKRFKLDESWDSEHNIKLLEEMPAVYALPKGLFATNAIKPGYTTWLAISGEKCWMGQPKPISFGNVTDGSSNTLAIVNVKPERAVPWTAPQDYRLDPEAPAAGLAVDASGSVDAAMLDGSAHRLPIELPAKTWQYLMQMNDGQVHQYEKN